MLELVPTNHWPKSLLPFSVHYSIIPLLLQSWLGCLTLLDTHSQVRSVRRSACISEEENKV